MQFCKYYFNASCILVLEFTLYGVYTFLCWKWCLKKLVFQNSVLNYIKNVQFLGEIAIWKKLELDSKLSQKARKIFQEVQKSSNSTRFSFPKLERARTRKF